MASGLQFAGQPVSRRKDLPTHFTDTQNNPPAVLLQLCTHRDLRVEHFRDRTPFLRRLGILLERCRVRARHFAHHIDVTLRDRPPGIQLLERQGHSRRNALGRKIRPAQLRRERHREASRMRRCNQLLGIGPGSILEARSK